MSMHEDYVASGMSPEVFFKDVVGNNDINPVAAVRLLRKINRAKNIVCQITKKE